MDIDEDEDDFYGEIEVSLRISGQRLPFDEITETLGVTPSHTHRRGEHWSPGSPTYAHDMWAYEPDIPASAHPNRHLRALWAVVAPHVDYLKSLAANPDNELDIHCFYQPEDQMSDLVFAPDAMQIITALGVPFEFVILSKPLQRDE